MVASTSIKTSMLGLTFISPLDLYSRFGSLHVHLSGAWRSALAMLPMVALSFLGETIGLRSVSMALIALPQASPTFGLRPKASVHASCMYCDAWSSG